MQRIKDRDNSSDCFGRGRLPWCLALYRFMTHEREKHHHHHQWGTLVLNDVQWNVLFVHCLRFILWTQCTYNVHGIKCALLYCIVCCVLHCIWRSAYDVEGSKRKMKVCFCKMSHTSVWIIENVHDAKIMVRTTTAILWWWWWWLWRFHQFHWMK